MDLPGDAAQQCGSVLNNQLPIASIPTLSPAHTIHLGHKNNLHPHSLTTVAGETVSAGLLKSNRVLLSPLQHQEQLICAFREPETNGSLSTLLPTLAQPQSTQFASNPESWNGKSNLLRVQPNQFQLIDYGFIEEFHTRPPSTGFATVRNESGHVAIGQRLSPTEYTDHKNRRLQTNANERYEPVLPFFLFFFH